MKEPILSIIVPGYNVEDYIEECIDSILAQTFTDYELIMIDDESPDNTGVIMDQYAEKYENFRVIHKKNEGISIARNLGINESRGRYIAFVDSDDFLTPSAYQSLVGSLERTGSDIAVGAVKRFNSQKTVYSFLHRKAVVDEVTETTIEKHPELVHDTTVWNKVFKKSLLVDNNIEFPEGVIYEDIPFTLEAHLCASKIDIIDNIVYFWRWREGQNKSWTQQRNDLTLYGQRLSAIKRGLAIIKAHQADYLLLPFFKKVYEIDIPLFIPDPKYGDLDYSVEFQKITYRFVKETGENYIDLVRPDKQVRLVALMNGDIDSMIGYTAYNTKGQKIVYKDKQLIFTNDYIEDKPWLSQVCLEKSVPLLTKIYSIKNDGPLQYEIGGVSYARYSKLVKHTNKNFSIYFEKVSGDEKDKIPLAFDQIKTKHAKYSSGRKTTVGIKIQLDFNNLKNTLSEGIWKIKITDSFSSLTSTGFFANPKKGLKKIAPFILDNFLIIPKYNNNWELSFRIEKIKNRIQSVAFKNNAVQIVGEFSEQVSLAVMEMQEQEEEQLSEDLAAVVTDSSSDLIEIPLNRNNPYGNYQLHFYDNFGNELDYAIDETFNDINRNLVKESSYFVRSNAHTLKFEYAAAVAEIVSCKLKNGKLNLKLKLHPSVQADDFSIRFISKDKADKFIFTPDSIRNNNFIFDIDLYDGTDYIFTPNKYNVYLDAVSDKLESYKIFASENSRKIKQFEDKNFRLKVFYTQRGELRVNSTQLWGRKDNSKLKRGLSYSILYPLMRLLPIEKEVIVYDSFWSSKFNDSPKAMYEYIYKNHPEFKHIWVFDKMNTKIEGPAEKVRKNSFKYWYYMARAKYFIENTNLPNQYSKRADQIEVQTFHGTFMKTMGFDEPHFKNGPKKRQMNFEKRNKRWDITISPSKYMTEKIRSAFNYEGEVIEVGYPRNDELYLNNNAKFVNTIKTDLGISPEKKVVLYAPTYREKGSFDLDMDLSLMRQQLGDDYVILVRLHYFVANNINISNFAPFAIDVSNYDNINDLYLISDVLITDYSSVMFDFAHLEKPMLFFAYDYEDYVNDTRGVYLDYEQTVPGPIVRTTEEIIAELCDLNSLKSKYKEMLHRFNQDFCEYGNRGDAAKISSEAMLSKNTDYVSEPLLREKIKNFVKFKKWYPNLLKYSGSKRKRNLIVFESFFGRNYSDNPKAIYEYMIKNHPEYKCLWSVNKEYADYFKENKIPYVERLSVRSAWIIGRAKYWIVNTRLPLWMKKPTGTTLIQTWHGTPLKTLGRDVALLTMPGMTAEKYHDNVVKDSDRWDYCLSPNKYSTNIFKRAFRLRNEQMINSGYPRNDILTTHSKDYADSIKEILGISKDKKVILYAPTWRDNEYVRSDYYTAKLHLDLEKMSKKFGDQAVLLVRTHYLIANNLNLKDNDFAIDVSNYQDINDLYIISDMLITDYSSVFFDYANLKRPIIFYAYDLEEYAGEIRGFYFDYSLEAPGPILTEEEQIYSEIQRQLEEPRLSKNYQSFVEKYCSWDDGSSTERAISFVLDKKDYSIKELTFEIQKSYVKKDIIIWSDVIGHGDYKILKNVLANGEKIQVTKKAILVDPIRNNEVGSPCYYIEAVSYNGWINDGDYQTLN